MLKDIIDSKLRRLDFSLESNLTTQFCTFKILDSLEFWQTPDMYKIIKVKLCSGTRLEQLGALPGAEVPD